MLKTSFCRIGCRLSSYAQTGEFRAFEDPEVLFDTGVEARPRPPLTMAAYLVPFKDQVEFDWLTDDSITSTAPPV